MQWGPEREILFVGKDRGRALSRERYHGPPLGLAGTGPQKHLSGCCLPFSYLLLEPVCVCICVCVCVYDVCVNLAVRFIWHHGLQYPPSPSHVLFYDSWSYVVFMLLLSICHLFYKVLTSNFLGRNYHSLWEVAATVPFLQPLNPPLSPFNLLLDWCSNEAISIFDPQACLCLIFPLDFLQG